MHLLPFDILHHPFPPEPTPNRAKRLLNQQTDAYQLNSVETALCELVESNPPRPSNSDSNRIEIDQYSKQDFHCFNSSTMYLQEFIFEVPLPRLPLEPAHLNFRLVPNPSLLRESPPRPSLKIELFPDLGFIKTDRQIHFQTPPRPSFSPIRIVTSISPTEERATSFDSYPTFPRERRGSRSARDDTYYTLCGQVPLRHRCDGLYDRFRGGNDKVDGEWIVHYGMERR